MKTFQEFILEKYYEPDQPLPSGKTPYGKATSSYYRQKGEFERNPNRTSDKEFKITQQGGSGRNAAARGADNPNFDSKPDPTGKYNIDTDSDYKLSVRDRKNDVEMRLRQKDQIAPGGKPVYDVEWYNYARSKNLNPGQARGVARNVADMWKNQVAPRIPSNSVITNFPITNDTSERNTRSKLYSKVAGFGKVGFGGRQYAAVGRPPSSKQAAKGVQRITPLSGNLDPESVYNRRELDTLRSSPKPKAYWAAMELARGQRRQIAPTKPSRPSMNKAVKALKSTPAIKAPAIPKPPRVKLPVTPKIPKTPNIRIKGGGRAALIGLGVQGAIAGAGALYNKMQSNKK
jgi:hypothetical protein